MNNKLKCIIATLSIIILCCILSACNHQHNYGSSTIIKEATCTQTGILEKKCDCGETIKEAIPATDHSFGDWIIEEEATCTTDGIMYKVCSVCDQKSSSIINAHGHVESDWIIDIEATCGANGSKHIVCTICETTVNTESIPATNEHILGSPVITKTPTCTEKGSQKISCTNCNYSIDEEIPATGHNFNTNNICTICTLFRVNVTIEDKINASKVTKLDHGVSEWYDECQINLFLIGDTTSIFTEYIEAPALVDIAITDENGTILYKDTLLKGAYQTDVTIDYSLLPKIYSNKGTLHYTVYNEGYFSFEKCTYTLDRLPWTVDVKLPSFPKVYSEYSYNGKIDSSCNITNITYEIRNDHIHIYLTGEKTYDSQGKNNDSYCYISYKIFDSNGYVVDGGLVSTKSLTTGQKFKDHEEVFYCEIQQGESYRLEFYDYR